MIDFLGVLPDLPRAMCAQVGDHTPWFPSDYAASQDARAICAGCPEQAPCLAFALEWPQAGIWGGTTENERQRMGRVVGIGGCGTTRGYMSHLSRREPICADCQQAHSAARRAKKASA